eukprot:1160044-Pelagomonas_calceolata.AAC.4
MDACCHEELLKRNTGVPDGSYPITIQSEGASGGLEVPGMRCLRTRGRESRCPGAWWTNWLALMTKEAYACSENTPTSI